MTILNDKQIMHLCMELHHNDDGDDWVPLPASQSMIHPFVPANVRSIPTQVYGNDHAPVQIASKVVSYGVSSFGYDTRLGDEFKIFTPTVAGAFPLIDPKQPDDRYYVNHKGDFAIIPPNSFLLGHTVEYFQIPEDVLVICLGKSTYARCGLIVNVTPLEPGWRGQITIEISNTTPLPAKVYANEGIAQLLFLRGERPLLTYKDKAGKYMDQTGVTPPRM